MRGTLSRVLGPAAAGPRGPTHDCHETTQPGILARDERPALPRLPE